MASLQLLGSFLVVLASLAAAERWSGNLCRTPKERYQTASVCTMRVYKFCVKWRRVARRYVHYEVGCCKGWTHHGDHNCNVPICWPPCLNGGRCVAPNSCRCPRGFTGRRCEARRRASFVDKARRRLSFMDKARRPTSFMDALVSILSHKHGGLFRQRPEVTPPVETRPSTNSQRKTRPSTNSQGKRKPCRKPTVKPQPTTKPTPRTNPTVKLTTSRIPTQTTLSATVPMTTTTVPATKAEIVFTSQTTPDDGKIAGNTADNTAATLSSTPATRKEIDETTVNDDDRRSTSSGVTTAASVDDNFVEDEDENTSSPPVPTSVPALPSTTGETALPGNTHSNAGEEMSLPGNTPVTTAENTFGNTPSTPRPDTASAGNTPSSPSQDTTSAGNTPSTPHQDTASASNTPGTPRQDTTSADNIPSTPHQDTAFTGNTPSTLRQDTASSGNTDGDTASDGNTPSPSPITTFGNTPNAPENTGEDAPITDNTSSPILATNTDVNTPSAGNTPSRSQDVFTSTASHTSEETVSIRNYGNRISSPSKADIVTSAGRDNTDVTPNNVSIPGLLHVLKSNDTSVAMTTPPPSDDIANWVRPIY